MVVLDSLQSGLQSAVANTELTATEQNTLALLYETLIARHQPGPGDDSRVMQTSEEHLSGRDGAEEEFDPSRQARFAIQAEGLHMGLNHGNSMGSVVIF